MEPGLVVCPLLVVLLTSPPPVSPLTCHCNGWDCPENFCQTDGLCRTSIERTKNGEGTKIRYQCLLKYQLFPRARPFECENSVKLLHRYVRQCCDSDYCNRNITLTLQSPPGQSQNFLSSSQTSGDSSKTSTNPVESQHTIYIVIVILSSAVVILAIGCLFFVIRFSRTMACHRNVDLPCWKAYTEVETNSCETISSTLQDWMSSTGSGSGSGLPLLLQRTVARQICLKEVIGRGRFGEVQRGEWRGSNVAVKIFSSLDEKSWVREVEVYQTSMLRHDNILGFIAADNKDNGTWTQLWLVTQYMEQGSLYDFLARTVLDPEHAISICLNIATGLAHLHLEILGTQGKPAIAHRDLKSKNVLVRADGVAAIGDLGLAVRHNSGSNSLDLPFNCKVGTKRYLAPEVLDNSINDSDFESFKQGDVYALGLVLWEVACRISTPGYPCPPAQPPYWDLVGVDPSLDEMKKVVCLNMHRPELPPELLNVDAVAVLGRVMAECWYGNPLARLSALRIKKSLTQILEGEKMEI